MSESDLPKHNPKLVQKSIEYANRFYGYDKDLTQADRQRLAGFFTNRLFLAPLMSLPVAFGFISLPNVLKRRNIFFNPKKRYLFTQVFLGFVGLGVGQSCGSALISVYQRQKLLSNKAALGAYDTLSLFPSQLGSQYYGATAQNPKFIMKDPKSIDWSQNPLFPLYLVVNRELIEEVKQEREEAVEQYEQKQQAKREETIEKRAGPAPTELTGTSWDKIIQKNKTEQTSQSPGYSKPSTDSSSNWDKPQDDFTDSEKKW